VAGTLIPEPGTFLLVATGLGILATRRRIQSFYRQLESSWRAIPLPAGSADEAGDERDLGLAASAV